MTSVSVELQDAVLGLLRADTDVAALVQGRIYDHMPASGGYPCITFGPSDYIEEDADCITARRETLQLDCWVQDHGRLWPARQLADAVKSALHLADAALVQHALVEMRVGQVRVIPDPDGVTGHGIVPVTALIEEN